VFFCDSQRSCAWNFSPDSSSLSFVHQFLDRDGGGGVLCLGLMHMACCLTDLRLVSQLQDVSLGNSLYRGNTFVFFLFLVRRFPANFSFVRSHRPAGSNFAPVINIVLRTHVYQIESFPSILSLLFPTRQAPSQFIHLRCARFDPGIFFWIVKTVCVALKALRAKTFALSPFPLTPASSLGKAVLVDLGLSIQVPSRANGFSDPSPSCL